MRVQGYEQLRLHDVDWSYYDNRDGKKWAGKVVDKVGFVNRGSHSEQMLLILFTDKTFICVGLEYKEDNSDEMILNDNWIYDRKFITILWKSIILILTKMEKFRLTCGSRCS